MKKFSPDAVEVSVGPGVGNDVGLVEVVAARPGEGSDVGLRGEAPGGTRGGGRTHMTLCSKIKKLPINASNN